MKSTIRRASVKQLTGFFQSTTYPKYKAGEFPCPIRLGANSADWFHDEAAAWIESRECCVSSGQVCNT